MPYTYRQSDIPLLDIEVDRGTDFRAWKKEWESYVQLSGLHAEQDATKVHVLTRAFSRATITVVENLGLTDAQKADITQTVEALQNHVDGQVNEMVERHAFRGRKQQQGESVDDYVVALRELAKTCNFCDNNCTQRAIRDQLTEGIRDNQTRRELLKVNDLTLARAIEIAKGEELAEKQSSRIHSSPDKSSVQAAKSTYKKTKAGNRTDSSNKSSTSDKTRSSSCRYCGSTPSHPRAECKAKEVNCKECGIKGHYAKVCQKKNKSPGISNNSAGARAVSTRVGCFSIKAASVSKLKLERPIIPAPKVKGKITVKKQEAFVDILPDSGADFTAIPTSVAKTLKVHKRDYRANQDIDSVAVNGSPIQIDGVIKGDIEVNGNMIYEDLHVSPDIANALLSWQAARDLQLIQGSYFPNQDDSHRKIQQINSDSRRSWIPTAKQLMAEFPTVFDCKVRVMKGEKFKIHLTPDAKPFCVNAPRSVPYALLDKLKSQLDKLLVLDIIKPITQPTEWCAPIVVANKKGTDEIRMCVDLSHLNKYVQRELYKSPTPAEAVADIEADNAKIFTCFDALKGYHQVPLDEESQKLTCFSTPFGRFMFVRAPYGISSISEHYNRRMDAAFQGLSGYRKIVDDVTVYDSDFDQHVHHVRQFLRRCEEHSIALNPDKFQFAQESVQFAGFMLSTDGYKLSDDITKAISSYPTPSCITDVRSFFGLANQLSGSSDQVAPALTPLKGLLSSKNAFTWTENHDVAFEQAKNVLTTAPTLAFYDMNKPTRLCTDASRHGLGFVLQQEQSDGHWALIQAGSRFLTDTETRYAVIELEMLAVTWAVGKCRIFLAGLPTRFTVITDHRPLIPILNSYRLDEIENLRLQRLRTRIMPYQFVAEWRKGSKNDAPDALSRFPVSEPTPAEEHAEFDIGTHNGTHDIEPAPTIAAARALAVGPQPLNASLKDLQHHAREDETYQELKELILNGFPETKAQLSEKLRPFWSVRHNLSIEDDFILYGCRLYIPTTQRPDILRRLHDSHQGLVRTKERARLIVYWPGLDHDITLTVNGCKRCQDDLPSHGKEPLIQKPRPERPFQEIAIDFAEHGGCSFLIMVDCLTDWPTFEVMYKNSTVPAMLAKLRQAFCRTAVPDIIWSDGGPQFTSRAFRDFCTQWGITSKISTAYYPQSNGKAESAVKSVKKIIKRYWNGRHLDEDGVCKAMLQYKNTPSRRDGLSPAQSLFDICQPGTPSMTSANHIHVYPH